MDGGLVVESRWIGKSISRVEDEELLRGAARYINDIYRPGEVHAVFVRSLHAHARIADFDLDAARRMPGVLGVFTHEDVSGRALPPYLWDIPPRVLLRGLEVDIRHHDQTLLPRDKVRYVGEAVAMVVAENRYVAEDAADLVGIDYDLLPVAATMQSALHPAAPRIHEQWDDNVAVRLVVRKGDVDDAFARAHQVVRDTFSMQRQAGIPIETRGAVAEWDPATRELTVWSSTQNVHPLRNAIATQLDLPPERVRVIAPSVGGGFGVKAILYPEDLLVAWAAMSLEAPVKWIEDRIENLQSAIHAREQTHDIALALSGDGQILGLKDSFTVDTGGFNALGLVIPYNTIAHLMGPYRVQSMQAQATAVVTNKTPTAPYRGAGRPLFLRWREYWTKPRTVWESIPWSFGLATSSAPTRCRLIRESAIAMASLSSWTAAIIRKRSSAPWRWSTITRSKDSSVHVGGPSELASLPTSRVRVLVRSKVPMYESIHVVACLFRPGRHLKDKVIEPYSLRSAQTIWVSTCLPSRSSAETRRIFRSDGERWQAEAPWWRARLLQRLRLRFAKRFCRLRPSCSRSHRMI
jgi:hypothetical protein